MPLKLREYQEEAVESIFDYFSSGGVGNPVIGLPTGTGKSLVIADFMKRAFIRYGTQRILVLTHVKELIRQNFEELMDYWPGAPAGIFSSGLKRRDIGYPILFGGIASVKNVIHDLGIFDLIIIDEAHLVSPEQKTMYQKVIKALRAKNKYLKVIGLTATGYRAKQGYLTEDGLFTDFCYDATTVDKFNYFLEEGYLTYLITPSKVPELIDVSGVGTVGGEYNNKQLEAVSNRKEVTAAAIATTLQLALDRKHLLVFATGISHVIEVTAALNAAGISATCVHSDMDDAIRDKNIADYKAGKYRAIVNNGILTTGFNFKPIDCIIMLRATKSPGLWVQMLGRGTRPVYALGYDLETTNGRLWAIFNSQKRNCLVLDFAGNTRRLGPVNDPRIPKKKGGGKGEAPYRICDVCGVINHAAALHCINCGTEFPRAVLITAEASTDTIITKVTPEIHDFKVTHAAYSLHTKPGRPRMLKATYQCGFRWFSEYILLDHGGPATNVARRWWRRMTNGSEPPENVTEALTRLDEIIVPHAISVWVNKKPYPEVRDYVFEAELGKSEAENRISAVLD